MHAAQGDAAESLSDLLQAVGNALQSDELSFAALRVVCPLLIAKDPVTLVLAFTLGFGFFIERATYGTPESVAHSANLIS